MYAAPHKLKVKIEKCILFMCFVVVYILLTVRLVVSRFLIERARSTLHTYTFMHLFIYITNTTSLICEMHRASFLFCTSIYDTTTHTTHTYTWLFKCRSEVKLLREHIHRARLFYMSFITISRIWLVFLNNANSHKFKLILL